MLAKNLSMTYVLPTDDISDDHCEIALHLPRRDLKALLFVPHPLSRIASLLLFWELALDPTSPPACAAHDHSRPRAHPMLYGPVRQCQRWQERGERRVGHIELPHAAAARRPP